VDVFVMFPTSQASALVTLTPIHEYLTSHGCRVEGAYVVIGDWPVQFLPVTGRLQEEALHEAVKTEVEGVPTWTLTAEHLVAIALHTGRAKDHSRIIQFLESGTLDREKLNAILARHALIQKWEEFTRRFLER
jgi:hypothetical protein